MGKKKNHDNKANSKGLSPKDEKEDRNVVESEMDVSLEIGFAGKKKSKGKRATKNVSFELLDDDQGNVKEDEDASISFSGKKKSKSGKRNPESVGSASGFSVLEEDGDDPIDEMEEDDSVVKFSGKKKSSKKKNEPKIDEDEPKMSSVEKDDVPMESCKSKKRKKKGGRTVQEDDELDKILAELGGPSTSISAAVTAASSQEVKVVIQPEPAVVDEAEDEGVVESAAAKKKRKKKEKAKEKKEKPEEKKVCKGVRRMQEEIARRNEAEQRKKRKEDEKEEERRKQVEREEQEEEARRMKKDREKEKRLKKKQEGKLLTPKQKEEQRRQEAKRNQFLSSKGVSLPADSGAPAKRPIYSTKKKSKGQHAKTEMVEEEESVAIDEVIMVGEEEKGKAPVEVEEKVEEEEAKEEEEEEEEEEEDDEWDAKSWDAADLDLNVKGAFEDGEVGSEPESSVKKEVKMSAQPAAVASSSHTLKIEKEISNVALQSEQSEGSSLRSPICCIMGHVDAGKTKLLDCIRGTNVQEGEAGGITQQIGATYFPAENIRERTKELRADAKLMVPGLLIIDTPGHECFINLRSHGSGLCDIAVVVVDIMHGLKKQTIESLDLLKMQNAYFIIALNKVDRLAEWKTCRNAPIGKALKQQSKDVQMEFNNRLDGIITQFKEQGLNTALYYRNKERGETFNIVPTSAISGEGIPDMLLLLVQWTQKTMVEKLTYTDKVQCTVLEVKVTEGHGTTIDVILVNGVLREGDQIVVCGMQGPIVTTIRALMTPRPMEELRIKGSYLHHKEIKGAQGIKIAGQGLELAIAGTSLHVVGPDDDIDAIKKSAMEEVKSVMTRIDKSGEGVCVQASSEGSLNALLEFLKTPEVNIPVSSTGIGPVHKKDVMRARLMLEKNKEEFAAILAFDVDVAPDVREHADEAGVKIFTANVIYHLFDQFKAYIRNLKEKQKKEAAEEAVFPCVLRILPGHVYRKTDPILMGVEVLEGIAKVGTPICVPSRDFICIGKIVSIENNSKPVDTAKKGQEVAIKILGSNPQERQKKYGRHFELEDELVSQISRRSIDILKANYREDLSKEDWRLVLKLKILFKIQ